MTILFNLTGHKASAKIFAPISVLLVLTNIIIFLWHFKIVFYIFSSYLVICYLVGRKNYGNFKYTYVDLYSDKVTRDYKCVYLADFQLDKSKSSFNKKVLFDIIYRTNHISKDILLLGGDYVNYPGNIDPFFEELKQLEIPKLGCFAVMGNHDYIDYDKIVKKIENLGIKVVDNKRQPVNLELTIVGVEDEWYGKPKLPTLYDEFNLCLAHNPDFIKSVKEDNKIDVMLSGHYHGGQFNIFIYPFNRIVSKYIRGQFNLKGLKLIVTNGLGGSMLRGTLGAYVRLFAQPEIIILTIKRKK